MADKNGEAKGITSNAVDVPDLINFDNWLPITTLEKTVVEQFQKEITIDGQKTDFTQDQIHISIDMQNKTVIFFDASYNPYTACRLFMTVEQKDGLIQDYEVFADKQTGKIVDFYKLSINESYQGSGMDNNGNSVTFNTTLEESTYYLKDDERNIVLWDCKNSKMNWYVTWKDQGTNKYYFYDNKEKKWRDNQKNEIDLDGMDTSQFEFVSKTFYLKKGEIEIPSSKDNNWTNADAITVYSRVKNTYDFFMRVLNRKGYDGENHNLDVFFRHNVGAYHDNEYGSLISFNNSYEQNTVAHEYTHAVERSISCMIYKSESGAIMEGYSDIFGEIVEDFSNDQELNNNCDWNHAGTNRVISDPSSKGYPKKANENKNGGEDYVHGHSTVVSHAAYLMSKKGCENVLTISELAQLWYNALFLLPANCDYSSLRLRIEQTAELLNFSESKKKRISDSFDEVGINASYDSPNTRDVNSEIMVYDKNNLAYDDYTIAIDGKEFTGLFKWGWAKKDYHKEISVDSTDPYELNLPKGDYTITIIDNFSGNKTYSKSIKARENQDKKNIEFATAFGFDYSVAANPELQVKDVNESLYDNYTVAITGKNESGTAYNKTVNVDIAEAQALDLETGKYSFLLTDNADKGKTKSFSVRVRADAPTSVIQVKTLFGKPYGEFNKSDLPSGVKEFNGHYYYIYNIPEITTWEQAQEYCRSKNGYLATLTTKEENAFAYSMLSSFNITGAYFGLHDIGYNDWQWVNSEAFSYSNWAYGEPSSYSEPYGMFYEQYVETWNDGDFGNYTSDDRAFICEWGAYEINSEQVSETPTQRTTSGERDVVLCLDMSGSMAGDKLQQTKEASIKFINTVLQEDASIAIVTYDDSARVLSDFSTNAEELISKINEISDGGSTNIEDGLVKSYNLLNYSNAKKQIIVLMSDGEPNEGKVGEELISYADSVKKEGVYIYTLGFFGGYSGQSAAQTLMEKIASEGCHYEVSDADSLVFFFGDIADTINGQQYIYIRIACPVDVKVSHNDETLNSNEENLSTRTSFGSLSFEENTSEYSEDDVDDRVKILRLKADDNYDISIEGTGRGRMNYTIGFMDENGEYSDFRKFTNIKIKKSTVIDTVAAKSKNTILNVDEDGDGKYDLKYKAGANERGEIVDYSYILYIAIAAVGLVVAMAAFLIIKKKINTRKRGT